MTGRQLKDILSRAIAIEMGREHLFYPALSPSTGEPGNTILSLPDGAKLAEDTDARLIGSVIRVTDTNGKERELQLLGLMSVRTFVRWSPSGDVDSYDNEEDADAAIAASKQSGRKFFDEDDNEDHVYWDPVAKTWVPWVDDDDDDDDDDTVWVRWHPSGDVEAFESEADARAAIEALKGQQDGVVHYNKP
jgi:hypothetical protein